MRKMIMVVMMVVAMVLTPITAYSAELKSLQDELYDEAMLDLFYDNYEHKVEYQAFFTKGDSSIEYNVMGEKYDAKIYYLHDEDTYYGTIYTKLGNFVANLKDYDAYNIISDIY